MKYNNIIKKLEEYNLIEFYDNANIEFSYISYNSKDIKEKPYLSAKE